MSSSSSDGEASVIGARYLNFGVLVEYSEAPEYVWNLTASAPASAATSISRRAVSQSRLWFAPASAMTYVGCPGPTSRSPIANSEGRAMRRMLEALLLDVRVDRPELRVGAHVGEDLRERARLFRQSEVGVQAAHERQVVGRVDGPAQVGGVIGPHHRAVHEQLGSLLAAEPGDVLARRDARGAAVHPFEHVTPQRFGVQALGQAPLDDVGRVVGAGLERGDHDVDLARIDQRAVR